MPADAEELRAEAAKNCADDKEEEKDMTNMVKLESMKNPQVVQKIERRCSTVDRKECHPAQDQH